MNPTERIAAIQRLVMAQQFDTALVDVTALEQSMPNDPGVLALHAHILRRLDRPGEAIAWLGRVIELNARIPNAWLELARCHQAQQDWPRARNAAASARALVPGSIAALSLTFDIAEAEGNTSMSEAVFAQWASIDPRAVERRLALGNHCFDRGAFDQAIRHFSAFVKLVPQRTEGYLNLAAAHAQRGELKAAAEALDAGIRLFPVDTALRARRCELGEPLGESAEFRGRIHPELVHEP